MNLLEFAKSIKRNIYIEIRPTGEYIISFGTDCTLIEQDLEGKHNKKIKSIHGRGPTLGDALQALINKMSNRGTDGSAFKKYFLRFPADFDSQEDVPVGLIVHEPNLIK